MVRVCAAASLLFALLLQRFYVPVQCRGIDKSLSLDVSLEPSNVVVTFPSQPCGDSVLVAWDPPAKSYFVESYRVTCEDIGFSDRKIEVVDGDLTEVIVGPLQLNSTYRCLVASWSKLYGASQAIASKAFSTAK